MRILTPLLLCSALLAADPALTIYNQNFAVVRETIPLDLQQGATSVKFVGPTAHLEPASFILHDPSGRRNLQILEQSYRADPVSAEMLLSLFEGQTIDFLGDSDQLDPFQEDRQPDRRVPSPACGG